MSTVKIVCLEMKLILFDQEGPLVIIFDASNKNRCWVTWLRGYQFLSLL